MYGREGSKFCGVVTTDSAPAIDFVSPFACRHPLITVPIFEKEHRCQTSAQASEVRPRSFCVLTCVPSKTAPDFRASHQLRKRLNENGQLRHWLQVAQ
ncbi:hypothetical protein IG631_16588 [Alternaria alternata]|nr:hypothetical protein IG631_16588 [Alternaria alternata]